MTANDSDTVEIILRKASKKDRRSKIKVGGKTQSFTDPSWYKQEFNGKLSIHPRVGQYKLEVVQVVRIQIRGKLVALRLVMGATNSPELEPETKLFHILYMLS